MLALRVLPAETRLTVYRWLHICGMATFDELVLEISLVDVAESLHANFYLYTLEFLLSGVSVATLSVEVTLVQSIFQDYDFHESGWRCLLFALHHEYLRRSSGKL